MQDVEATVCHLSERPLRAGDRVLLKHTTRTVQAVVKEITDRLDIAGAGHGAASEAHLEAGTEAAEEFDVDFADRARPDSLTANDIGRVVLRTASPILLEPYAADRETGSFLLIDPASGDTLTAGMSGDPLGVFS